MDLGCTVGDGGAGALSWRRNQFQCTTSQNVLTAYLPVDHQVQLCITLHSLSFWKDNKWALHTKANLSDYLWV
jgi:hypothetical protein